MSGVELKPEHRDLLMLLRAAIDGTAPPSAPADWTAVLAMARFHQVDLFLYPAVAGWLEAMQPAAELMARWRSAFLAAVVNYERASAQLKEILQVLHEADVPVIPLKGAWLAETIYEEGAQRPMCDFDLLVPLDQLDCARAAFESIGYTTPDHYLSTERDKDIHYFHPDRPMMIELHFRIWHEGKTNVVEPDTNRLWQDPLPAQLHGIPVCALPPERLLCYLVQHILHHSLTIGLKAYLDLILLIRTRRFDAELLEVEAKALGVFFGARFILQLACDIADMAPPEALRSSHIRCEIPGSNGNLPTEHADQTSALRKTAFRAVLELSVGSSLIKPEIADSRGASLITRLKIGFGVVFKPSGFIRSAYPEAVQKCGLVGGYYARLIDLLKRSQPVREKSRRSDDSLNDDFENFDTRRALSEWLHEKDREL